MQPYVWADADLVDARRYAGYPLYGTGTIVFPFPWWFKYYQAMEVRFQTMTADEGAVAQTFLTNLRTLEAAIPAAGANLDTEAAAVWTHNPREVADRMGLYGAYRRQWCAFLGIPPGPALDGGAAGRAVVV
ncbi:MAG: hypothetical protein ACREEW_12820 [Caulobacteraceae bacterium]